MRHVAIIFAIGIAGCTLSFPEPGAAPYPCAQEADCAEGFTCVAEICQRLAGQSPDAGQGQDAGLADASEGGPDSAIDAGAQDSGGSDAGGTDAGGSDAGCSLTQCGVDCVDLQTSVSHCGMCNKDCQVGSCAFGQCQPEAVHQQTGAQPTSIVIDLPSGQVYWTDQRLGGAVLGRDVDLAQPTFVVQSPVRYATGLAANADYVAWSALDELSGPRRGAVSYKARPFTGMPVTAATEQSNPSTLTIAAGYVYWSSDSPLYIRGHALGQTAADLELRITLGASYAQAMVADATELFWADSQADVYAQTLDLASTPAPRQVVTSTEGEASDLILNNGTLYWAEAGTAQRGQARIFSAPTANGLITPVVVQADPSDPEQSVTGLAFYEGYLYYTTATRARRAGSLFRVANTGGTPERLLQGAGTDQLRDVAVGAGRIFWTQEDTVYVLAVP